MCVGYFLVLLDVTIVNVALPRIGSGLHANVSELQWVVDGYALALASLMLAGGTVGDLHGHKRVVLAGLVVFGAASLACGLAPSIAALIAARAIQGLGAAMLLPGTLAIISTTFRQGRAQARAIGLWAGIGSLALPAGPLLGGLLISGFGWRAIYLINVPLVLVSSIAALLVVNESSNPRGHRLDPSGAVVGSVALLAMTFAFIEGGRTGAGSPEVIGAIVAAVLLAGLFVVVENRRGSAAMLPLSLFRRPAFTVANAAAGTMNLCTLGALFVLTLFLQTVQHRSPLVAGLELIPLFAPLAVIAPLAGRLTSKIGPRAPMAVGLLIAGLGIGLLATVGANSHYLVILPAFLLWGIGLGVLTPAVVAAAIGAVPSERSGLASAINNTSRQAGGAIGIAIAGAIAGSPASHNSFLSGLHAVALVAALLYLVAAGCGLALVPGSLRPRARTA
jgi:DHA2 family methylenomycin A resistance protein-like MFS transporter